MGLAPEADYEPAMSVGKLTEDNLRRNDETYS